MKKLLVLLPLLILAGCSIVPEKEKPIIEETISPDQATSHPMIDLQNKPTAHSPNAK